MERIKKIFLTLVVGFLLLSAISLDVSAAKNYKAGNVYKLRDMKPEAIECYQTVLENFSDTALAPKARAALEELGVKVEAPTVSDEEASDDEAI